MNFDTIEYLKNGAYRQIQAYDILNLKKIFIKLEKYEPILVGTIPLKIDIASSDLDIICCFYNREKFVESVKNSFGNEPNFTIKEIINDEILAIAASFQADEFKIEIFGQNIPTKQQLGYRHMIIEYNLLQQYGEAFRQRIINLKNKGFKTEPAFAMELNLEGDPYISLLKYEVTENKF